MSNQVEKPTRYWYEYRGERFLVPEQFVYKIHESMGGGYDISEAFFTWAFSQHNISITDIDIIYSNHDRTPKSKDVAASSTFFVAMVKGRDKFGVEKVGDGEVGNESINNFQRKFPAGLAIKRAKVNMGKEFLNLVDLRIATDCRDFKVDFGEHKGKRLEDISRTNEGMKTLQWMASERFNGDALLKTKIQEFLQMASGNASNNNASSQDSNQQRPTNQTSSNQGGQQRPANSSNPSTPKPLTEEQKNVLALYRQNKGVTNDAMTVLAKEVCGNQFTWQTCTQEQGETLLRALKQKHGNP